MKLFLLLLVFSTLFNDNVKASCVSTWNVCGDKSLNWVGGVADDFCSPWFWLCGTNNHKVACLECPTGTYWNIDTNVCNAQCASPPTTTETPRVVYEIGNPPNALINFGNGSERAIEIISPIASNSNHTANISALFVNIVGTGSVVELMNDTTFISLIRALENDLLIKNIHNGERQRFGNNYGRFEMVLESGLYLFQWTTGDQDAEIRLVMTSNPLAPTTLPNEFNTTIASTTSVGSSEESTTASSPSATPNTLIEKYEPANVTFCPDNAVTIGLDPIYLTTPNYPQNYDNSKDCIINVTSANTNAIHVNIIECELEHGEFDYLKIQTLASGELLQKIDGSVHSGSYTYNEAIQISFHSDFKETYKGCLFQISQIQS